MKNIRLIKFNRALLAGLIVILAMACERELSNDHELAGYPKIGEIFTDVPVAMGSDFYFPYIADEGNPIGSKLDAWSVDNEVSYQGSASMRFDVPDGNNIQGNYAGGILRAEGARDLSGFTALTFWAKATQNVAIGEIGFGEDFLDNRYMATIYNVPLTTNWQKYIIPIPDPSKLTQERGMFRYSTGSVNGLGYTFWIDELKFENIGTLAQSRPAILNGEDVAAQSFIGLDININGVLTVNLLSGLDLTVNAAPAYFDFNSSNPSVAVVDENGVVNVVGEGEPSVITAKLNGVRAEGSLTVESLGVFLQAPLPSLPETDVISIFSDVYSNNVNVDYFNGYWEPYQTTESANFEVNGDYILNYVNFNFVGTSFASAPIDASGMSKAHFDIFVPGDVAGAQLKITLKDFGADGVDGGDDDTNIEHTINSFTEGEWKSVDINMDGFTRDRIGLIIYENLGSTLTNFYVDNIFLHNSEGNVSIPKPTEPAPTPTQNATDVISIFSDAYTNIASVDLNPNWGQQTAVSEILIDGNNTLLHAGLNYQGIDFNDNRQDISGKSFLHLDYWTENSTSLNVYLISPGPQEKPYALSVPTEGNWVSVDIPLSEFSDVVNLTELFQFKFDGNGDIYIDNIYFY